MRNNVFPQNTLEQFDEPVYLNRPNIHNLLEKSMQKPVTMVIAGAGYGKTQAVYMYLKECGALAVWQQLTVLDNLGARFWDNFVNAVSVRAEKVAANFEALGFPDTDAKFDMFLTYCLAFVNPQEKIVVVYDDFHFLNEKKTLRFIEKFIDARIPNISFILISRNEPEINTARLFAQGLIAMVSEDDLRFNESDIDQYFRMQNVNISPHLISEIYTKTEGWILAIRLIEISIKKGVAHEKYAITAMKLNVYKLIESDVYSHLGDGPRLFLIKLSLFDSLSSELVEELAAGDRSLIHCLLKTHSFIRFDSFSNMYYIHHMFLEFLRAKQNILSPSQKRECYRNAANWYASNGYAIDAISCYGKAEDYEGILKIALYNPNASDEEGALVLEIMNRAKPEVYDNPMLALLRARAYCLTGKKKECMNEFESIIRKQEALQKTRENLRALNELYALAGVAYYQLTNYTDDFRFVDYLSKAYQYTQTENTPIILEYPIQEVGAYVLRICSEKKEDMKAYMNAVRVAADCAHKIMPGCMCGIYSLAQAELNYYNNTLKMAEKYAHQALYQAREHNQHAVAMRAIFYLIRISLAEGNYAKIQTFLSELDLQLGTQNSPVQKTLHDIASGWFYVLIGQVDLIANWIRNDSDNISLYSFASGTEFLIKVKYYLCEKKYHDLLSFLELLEIGDEIKSFLLGRIAIAIMKAVCLYHMGQKDRAVQMFREAYLLAEPNDLTTQFIELGNDMVSLIKYTLKTENSGIPEDWLLTVLKKASTYAKKVSKVSMEFRKAHNLEPEVQLTQKELQLLNDVFYGMTKSEIAISHNLSQNYVKNRLRGIYAKLEAENANDAIRIALYKGLIK